MIALTFDDGPSPYTPLVVRILVRMHVPATFFVVGQQLHDFADGLRDELAPRFVVGDHTENHAWLPALTAPPASPARSHDAAVRDRAARRAGAAAVQAAVRGLRLGHAGDAQASTRMLMVLWSVDPGDWRAPRHAGDRRERARERASPGAIVIMHDGGGDRSQTVAALPAIISRRCARGYRARDRAAAGRADPPPRSSARPAWVRTADRDGLSPACRARSRWDTRRPIHRITCRR